MLQLLDLIFEGDCYVKSPFCSQTSEVTAACGEALRLVDPKVFPRALWANCLPSWLPGSFSARPAFPFPPHCYPRCLQCLFPALSEVEDKQKLSPWPQFLSPGLQLKGNVFRVHEALELRNGASFRKLAVSVNYLFSSFSVFQWLIIWWSDKFLPVRQGLKCLALSFLKLLQVIPHDIVFFFPKVN